MNPILGPTDSELDSWIRRAAPPTERLSDLELPTISGSSADRGRRQPWFGRTAAALIIVGGLAALLAQWPSEIADISFANRSSGDSGVATTGVMVTSTVGSSQSDDRSDIVLQADREGIVPFLGSADAENSVTAGAGAETFGSGFDSGPPVSTTETGMSGDSGRGGTTVVPSTTELPAFTETTAPVADSSEDSTGDAGGESLNAGSINDGDDVDAYLRYRAELTNSGVVVRPLDVRDSTVIAVKGDNGLPVLDAEIQIWNPLVDESGPVATLRTTAGGTVRFLPEAMAGVDWELFEVRVVVDGTTEVATFERGQDRVEVTMAVGGGFDGSVPVDIHFVLDATGSMDDEIARLRSSMSGIAAQIDALASGPDVRFGITVYRDLGDLFFTRTFDLTGDLDAFLAALADVEADGGGDYPEALDEALAEALADASWRPEGAVKLMIVIADAPPQVKRDVPQPYTATALKAAARGMKILPVVASGADNQAEYVMRELAFVTGGRFVFLSYGEAGSATGDSTDITSDDYDELPLDQLIVRLVQDEILALITLAPAETPPTTVAAPEQ